jgi:hypothetical protein
MILCGSHSRKSQRPSGPAAATHLRRHPPRSRRFGRCQHHAGVCASPAGRAASSPTTQRGSIGAELMSPPGASCGALARLTRRIASTPGVARCEGRRRCREQRVEGLRGVRGGMDPLTSRFFCMSLAMKRYRDIRRTGPPHRLSNRLQLPGKCAAIARIAARWAKPPRSNALWVRWARVVLRMPLHWRRKASCLLQFLPASGLMRMSPHRKRGGPCRPSSERIACEAITSWPCASLRHTCRERCC